MSDVTHTSAPQTYARALAALATEAVARAGRMVDGPDGMVAVVDPRWPDSHDSNKVVVSRETTPTTMLDFADQALGGAGVPYRQLLVLADVDDAGTAAARGYTRSPLILMLLTDPPAPHPASIDVREVDEDAMREVMHRTWRAGNPTMTEVTARQLVARRDAYDAPVTRLVAYDDGLSVAHADVRHRDGLAEIDLVGTLPEARNRGFATALCVRAVELARAAGEDLFLVADADDWPKQLYARLGFATMGVIHELHRPAGDPDAPSVETGPS